jgi:tRNA G10  N-methylase Trm11
MLPCADVAAICAVSKPNRIATAYKLCRLIKVIIPKGAHKVSRNPRRVFAKVSNAGILEARSSGQNEHGGIQRVVTKKESPTKRKRSAPALVKEQLAFYDFAQPKRNGLTPERLGTFQDSLRAPVHRWFKYPAGFSYKFVEVMIEDYKLGDSSLLLDPFAGSGTTLVTAKHQGVPSVGIEAHPFVFWVAQTKCFWEYDTERLRQTLQRLLSRLHRRPSLEKGALDEFPALVHKCYSEANLRTLKFIRDTIDQMECADEERAFFRLALTDTLRSASKAGTGWPYIAPSKYQAKNEQPALDVFSQTVQMMFRDLLSVLTSRRGQAQVQLYQMDARQPYPIEAESVDVAVTSPPYLNNYDYADRTRLETYFFGWAKSWRDITEQVRDRLIISATTQIRRTTFADAPVSSGICELDARLYAELSDKVSQLKARRLSKGGKKSYDLMVAGYFNDMLLVIQQVYRVLKPGAAFALVLGDSAPYSVYIPTEEYLGRLGRAVGFSQYTTQALRERGGKWANNPQRHKVALKEGILLLQK